MFKCLTWNLGYRLKGNPLVCYFVACCRPFVTNLSVRLSVREFDQLTS